MSATKRRWVLQWLAALAASGALGASVVSSYVSFPNKIQLLFLFLAMILTLLTAVIAEADPFKNVLTDRRVQKKITSG
jgi:hypothetical protein